MFTWLQHLKYKNKQNVQNNKPENNSLGERERETLSLHSYTPLAYVKKKVSI